MVLEKLPWSLRLGSERGEILAFTRRSPRFLFLLKAAIALWSWSICVSWVNLWKLLLITLTNLQVEGEYVITTGMRGETSIGLVCKNELKHFLKKDQQYPLVERAENKILTASPKSLCWVQILWNLSNWDLIIPANVCFGWKLVLNSKACVSVGLKKTLTSNLWSFGKFGPLNVVVSKKSIEDLLMVDFSLMEALWSLNCHY